MGSPPADTETSTFLPLLLADTLMLLDRLALGASWALHASNITTRVAVIEGPKT